MCGRVIVGYEELISAAAESKLAAWITGTPAGIAYSWQVKPTHDFPDT